MVPCIKTKALSALFLIVLFLVPVACAGDPVVREANPYKAPDGTNPDSDLFSAMSVKVESYNEKFDEVPALFRRLVGSKQIAGRVKLENDEMLYVTFIMSGGKVIEFYKYETSIDPYSKFEPSIIVETDEQEVRKILDSDDSLKEAINSMNEGSLEVETKGFFEGVELRLLKELYSS